MPLKTTITYLSLYTYYYFDKKKKKTFIYIRKKMVRAEKNNISMSRSCLVSKPNEASNVKELLA